MSEDIKSLIEKIQQEGIQAAEVKAREIEAGAVRKAQEVVKKAQKDAQQLLSEAEEKVARLEENARTSLSQASRDIALGLKQEIQRMLTGIVAENVLRALGIDEIKRIIVEVLRNVRQESGAIEITLNQNDAKKLEQEFLGQLKEAAQKGITIKASDEIAAGFVISFDAGKSHFDCSDKEITKYLISLLNPKLRELIQ